MNKKICHITSVHKRYDGRIFKKQCQALQSEGYDVTLLVNDLMADEVLEGIKIISTQYQPKSRLLRFLNSGSMMLKKAIEIDAEIYQLHDPDLLPVGNKLKKMGKKVIFDSHEDYPIDIIEKEWIPSWLRSLISNAYMWYEKISVKHYDAVITVSPHIVDRLKRINPNTVMITNYPIIGDHPVATITDYDARSPVICFAGAINRDWSHHVIIEAIKDIENVKYVIVGPSTEAYLTELSQKEAWSKTDYRGLVKFSQVQEIYNDSRMGIAIHYTKSLEGKGTLGNTKLFEFMEAGLPVICSNYPLWKDIVEKHHCGLSVSPRDVNEVQAAIQYLLENPEAAKAMGENGVKAVYSEYNWETQVPILIELYKQICKTMS